MCVNLGFDLIALRPRLSDHATTGPVFVPNLGARRVTRSFATCSDGTFGFCYAKRWRSAIWLTSPPKKHYACARISTRLCARHFRVRFAQAKGNTLIEETSFSTLFPKYREHYLRENWPKVTSVLKGHVSPSSSPTCSAMAAAASPHARYARLMCPGHDSPPSLTG